VTAVVLANLTPPYIDTQAEHHRKWSFEQEFMTLLKKSGAQYDPRFVLG